MANLSDSIRDLLFAGVGAVALGAEKGKEILDVLVEKGEITVDQGKQINQELQRKATEAAKSMRDNAVEARMKAMTAEEREEFVAMVAEMAAKQNAEDAEAAAAAAAEAEAAEAEEATEEVVEVEAEVVEAAAAGEGEQAE